MESFIEYEIFLKNQESKQSIFELSFGHEITLKHLERLLNTNIEKNTDGLFAYILIKNFCNEAETNDEDYACLQNALVRIFEYCMANEKNNATLDVVVPIIHDACFSDVDKCKYSLLKCAVLDAFVEKAPGSFYSAISSTIENMTVKHNITYLADILNQSNSEVMNLMLDNLILELRIMAMYLEIEKTYKIELFDFSKAYFDEIFFLISTSEIMEEDMTVLFVLNYRISALTNEHVLPITTEILSSRDFMISESCMARIFKEIMYTLSLKPFNTFAQFLAFIFTSPALVYFNEDNASSIVSYVAKQSKSREVVKVFRKIYFDIKDSGESRIMLNFFRAVSEMDVGGHFSEFHTFFLEQMNRYDIMEYYAGFIANSQTALPVHVFLGHCSHSKIFTFYKAFFKKVKKGNEEQIKSRKSATNKTILELFRFIVESRDQELVYLLPLVPFVPTNLDTLYAVFELYIFLFSMNLHKKMHLFYLKTPALINISFHLFVLEEFNPEIVTFLREIGIKEIKFQNLAFLAIIYNAESKKLENFDFSGVLEYVQDEKTLQCFDEDLRTLMKHIHTSCKFPSKEFNKLYIDTALLILKKSAFRTTKLILMDILSALLKKDTLSKYDLDFHRDFFVILKTMELSDDKMLFSEFLSMYLDTLEALKTTPYILNYIICFIADFKCTYKNLHFILAENIIHFISTTDFVMRRIMHFPDLDRDVLECNCNQCRGRKEVDSSLYSDSADMNETGAHVADRMLRSLYYNTILDDLSWIIDLICIRRNCVEVVRRSLELLKMRVYLSFSLKDLFILYRICNILNIEKNQNFYAFLVIKNNPNIIHEKSTIQLLAKEAGGLYKYHFENLLAATTGSICADLTKEDLEAYSVEELVYFNNLYRKKSIYDLAWNKIAAKLSVSRADTNGDSVLYIGYDDYAMNTWDTQISQTSIKQSIKHIVFTKKSWMEEKKHVNCLLEDCGIDFTYKQQMDSIIAPVDSGKDMLLCESSSYFICTANITILDLIAILQKMQHSNTIIEIATAILKKVEKAKIVFFIPQLVQCLFKKGFLGEFDFLLAEDILVHQLIWNLRANGINTDHILKTIGPEKRAVFSLQDTVFKALADISKNLIVFVRETKAFKTVQINKELESVHDLITRTSADIRSINEKRGLETDKTGGWCDSESDVKGIYLPTDPKCVVSNIVLGSGRSLQSAAKMPFMVSFKMQDGADKKLILKNGDDCRQDMLALQVIELFRTVFKESNLDISLFPYKVVAIDFECGVIEVIENAITRDQMGKEQINSLTEFFQYKFGFRESRSYIQALHNFVSSYTGYSLVTYFLNIKDRHNGNIMIDDKGHIIHIDFGFMLEISPGNINFEIPLKLTGEIHDLMKGTHFERYKELMVKGFLAIRKRSKEVMWLIESFRDSKLPCFRKNAIKNLDKRFMHELDDEGARKFVLNLIEKSVLSHRTWIYDKYQAMANDIRF